MTDIIGAVRAAAHRFGRGLALRLVPGPGERETARSSSRWPRSNLLDFPVSGPGYNRRVAGSPGRYLLRRRCGHEEGAGMAAPALRSLLPA